MISKDFELIHEDILGISVLPGSQVSLLVARPYTGATDWALPLRRGLQLLRFSLVASTLSKIIFHLDNLRYNFFANLYIHAQLEQSGKTLARVEGGNIAVMSSASRISLRTMPKKTTLSSGSSGS